MSTKPSDQTDAPCAHGVPAPHGLSVGADVFREMARVLDRPPALTVEALRGETQLTRRWSHGALHDGLPGLSKHVIMAHYGAGREISLRSGYTRLSSRTRPNTIVIIPQGHDGRWDISGSVEVSQVYLSDQRLRASASELTDGRAVELLDRVCFEDRIAACILGMLSDEVALNAPSGRLFLEQTVDLLCVQLIRGHSTLGAIHATTPRGGLADWQVKRVISYMRDNLEQDIGLGELAALINLSRFHFCAAFRRATGCTPYEWLIQQRISRARELLSDPSLPITDIALTVGYGNPSAFTAGFRRVVGMTPSEYRNRL